jgi:hypothetical protein
MEQASSGSLEEVLAKLPFFDGFPYLVTRISPALYHIILLPRDDSPDLWVNSGASQAALNQLETCLVVAADSCYYYDVAGVPRHDRFVPRGGTQVYDRLRPFWEFPPTPELAERQERLTAFAPMRDAHIFGDLTKGGRPATAEEAEGLAGLQRDGSPVGLLRCVHCGRQRGECLDPSPHSVHRVVAVHCLCENRNRCAGCGSLLYGYKLNANFYHEAEGRVCHVPGFCGLSHRCEEVRQ